MASLFEAIVQQNLAVLTRGNTLRPQVLLLGGPNTYIRGMQECWKSQHPEDLGRAQVPAARRRRSRLADPGSGERAVLRGAGLGRVRQGRRRSRRRLPRHRKPGMVHERRPPRREAEKGRQRPEQERSRASATSKSATSPRNLCRRSSSPGQVVEGFMGIDGGSTSTKAVLVDKDKRILVKCYQLSKGNPIEDTQDMFAQPARSRSKNRAPRSKSWASAPPATPKTFCRDVLNADVAIVETVAHTEAALHFYPHADVICDVGGQDIKLIILQDGRVKDFKLNTQCSAGNGYFLQSTAIGFGYEVTEFADLAFNAKAMPMFGYGCAVFMQSDIVDFQRQGWKPEEILAGLANVLPKNIWLYVSQIPNLASLGTHLRPAGRHAAQPGGRQGAGRLHRVALPRQGRQAERHRARALRRIRRHRRGHRGQSPVPAWAARPASSASTPCKKISYITHRNEDTRCYFCKNKCLRTFIDVKLMPGVHRGKSRLQDLQDPHRRGHQAPDRQQQLRQGPGRRRERHARNQEGHGLRQGRQSQHGRNRGQGGLQVLQAGRRRRSAAALTP